MLIPTACRHYSQYITKFSQKPSFNRKFITKIFEGFDGAVEIVKSA